MLSDKRATGTLYILSEAIADAPRNLIRVVRRQSIELLTQHIEQRFSICLRRSGRKEGREKGPLRRMSVT